MTRLRPAFLVVLSAGTVALGGCGSTPLSPTQLRTRATTICTRADRKLRSIAVPQSAQGASAFLKQGASALGRELDQLRSLSASGDAGRVYNAGLAAVSAELSALHRTVDALGRGAETVPTVRALSSRLTPLESQANDAWRALQIPACMTH